MDRTGTDCQPQPTGPTRLFDGRIEVYYPGHGDAAGPEVLRHTAELARAAAGG